MRGIGIPTFLSPRKAYRRGIHVGHITGLAITAETIQHAMDTFGFTEEQREALALIRDGVSASALMLEMDTTR